MWRVRERKKSVASPYKLVDKGARGHVARNAIRTSLECPQGESKTRVCSSERREQSMSQPRLDSSGVGTSLEPIDDNVSVKSLWIEQTGRRDGGNLGNVGKRTVSQHESVAVLNGRCGGKMSIDIKVMAWGEGESVSRGGLNVDKAVAHSGKLVGEHEDWGEYAVVNHDTVTQLDVTHFLGGTVLQLDGGISREADGVVVIVRRRRRRVGGIESFTDDTWESVSAVDRGRGGEG